MFGRNEEFFIIFIWEIILIYIEYEYKQIIQCYPNFSLCKHLIEEALRTLNLRLIRHESNNEGDILGSILS